MMVRVSREQLVAIAILVIGVQAWPQNLHARENYPSGRTGQTQLIQHVVPTSHNLNSNQNQAQGTPIVTPPLQVNDSGPSTRSYSTRLSDQTLEDYIEQFPPSYSTETNLRDSLWTNKEEQTIPYRTGVDNQTNPHLTNPEDQVKSHEIPNRGSTTNSGQQYSNERFSENGSYGGGTVNGEQNISKFRTNNGQLEGNQSEVAGHITEKVSDSGTLTDTHFQNVPSNETHQMGMLDEQSQGLTYYSRSLGKAVGVSGQGVGSVIRDHTVLRDNQSVIKDQNGVHEAISNIGYPTEPSKERGNGSYNARSLSQSQDIALTAIPVSRRMDNTAALLLEELPTHQNITLTQQNGEDGGSYIRRVTPIMSDTNISNNHPFHKPLPVDGHKGQETILQFNHSESVIYTPPTPESRIPLPYNQQNSREDLESRSSPVFRWKNRWTAKGQNATQSTGGSKIVFPGEEEKESNTVIKFTPQVSSRRPNCADEFGLCESPDNYPQDYVRRILENEASPYVFGSDLLDVDLRINPDEEVSLCPSMEQLLYPKMAQNKEDKWMFVINQDSYIQGIRVEKCGKQSPCTFSENFPAGYSTSCQQKFIYRKLLALGEDGKPISDSFRLPSCCSCVVTKIIPTEK